MGFGFVRGLAVSIATLVIPAAGFGAITANFDGAAGDGYPGTAGSGWSGGWVSSASGSSSASWTNLTASTSGEMSAGAGNYLSNQYTINGSGYHVLSRQYQSTSDVDLTKAHIVSFKFRIDSAISDFKNSPDSMSFDDDSVNGSYFVSAPTWLFGFAGYATSIAPAHRFTVYNGNRNGTAGTSIDTGIDVVSGTVYTFTIATDPTTKSYNFNMTDGTNSFSRSGLGWKTSAASVGGNLNILGQANVPSQTRRFDLDSVSIVAAPEPLTLSSFIPASVAILLRRRNRSRART